MAVNFCASAQNEALDSINRQLRHLFSPLSRPNNNYQFLYDMAVHVTDSVFFQKQCPDTSETNTWYKVYEEMYHAAYDTTQFVHPETVFDRGNQFYQDTIPIGIMHFSHYMLKPDAMSTGNYFDFDTVNTILTDKAGRASWPYADAGIFMAAPLVEASHFSNPTFRIDPQFIFHDAANAGYYLESQPIKINFDDGNGWISFDPNVVTHHQVTYTDSATSHVITVCRGEVNNPSEVSRAIMGTGINLAILPDQFLNFPGIRAGLYGGCGSVPTTGKLVIYVSGFDVFDNVPGFRSEARTVQDIYAEMIQNDRIVQLKNFGYNFLVVDWASSTIDMRFNALYLVNLLHQLKCNLANDQQFVVIGESMGGVIARYALTYMETEDYQTGDGAVFFADAADPNNVPYLATHSGIFSIPGTWPGECRMEKMHNTRLFISSDAPQQGATVPIAYQHLYRTGMSVLAHFIGMGIYRTTTAANLFLDGQAAQQLLLYHVDTRSGAGNLRNYTSHPDHNNFYNQLIAMGSYPRFAKVVTMSDGALDGQAQVNKNTGAGRVAGDRLIDFDADLYGKIFGIKIPLFGGSLLARTNNTGHLYHANLGFFALRIKLRWFGVKFDISYNSALLKDESADVLPYCTSAGGFVGDPTNNITPGSYTFNLSSNYPILNFFSYTNASDPGGCATFTSRFRTNGFASTNYDMSNCSDGIHFCLVPLQSALDYGQVGVTPALGHNIQADNINVMLNLLNPEVDVMIARPRINPNSEANVNVEHPEMRNDPVRNLRDNSFIYFSCITNPQVERVEGGMLNLEIGDETLYLENCNLQWQGDYETEYDIHVNERNPHYTYPGQPFTLNMDMFQGAFSRTNAFGTGNNGLATFIYDRQGSPTGIGLRIANPQPANFQEIDQPLLICCQDFIGTTPNPVDAPEPKLEKPTYLKLFPNPNTGKQLTLQYQLKNAGRIAIDIYNLTGQLALHKSLPVANATLPTTSVLQLPTLNPGMYMLRLSNGSESKVARFVVIR